MFLGLSKGGPFAPRYIVTFAATFHIRGLNCKICGMPRLENTFLRLGSYPHHPPRFLAPPPSDCSIVWYSINS